MLQANAQIDDSIRRRFDEVRSNSLRLIENLSDGDATAQSMADASPGSTIGNMTVPVAIDFLRAIAHTLGKDAFLLIGIDRIKDPKLLIAAYDDAQGITARFNLNLIQRINRELEGTIPAGAFRHVALWNDYEARIEMHLEAVRDVEFAVAGESFSIAQGETIHTENSLKYGPREARVLLRAGGWQPIAEWTDPQGLFALVLASSPSPSSLPP